jgi:hypothetical protein
VHTSALEVGSDTTLLMLVVLPLGVQFMHVGLLIAIYALYVFMHEHSVVVLPLGVQFMYVELLITIYAP